MCICVSRLSQLLKGADVVTLRKNEAGVKFQMDIVSQVLLLPHSASGSQQLLLSTVQGLINALFFMFISDIPLSMLFGRSD